ncbi:MAG: sortase [Thermomicrobiales bacterium]
MPYITEYVYRPVRQPLHHRMATWGLIAVIPLALILITLPFWPQAAYTISTAWPTHATDLAQAQSEASSPRPPGSGNWLLIPAIGVKTPIVDGPDIGVLDTQEGVWHQTGTAGVGNLVIAGHRFKYLPPNQTTFSNLDKLTTGDTIVIWWQGQRHAYQLSRSWVVGGGS